MAERALMPDYLRLLALFGIVVMNVQFIAFPTDGGFMQATQQMPVDRVATWLVNGLATLKTYGLFSFMFGVGLAFQMRSAERRGLAFGRIYRNRMLGLGLLGLLHGVFFFFGDILLIYALTGSILYLWRAWEVRRLVRVGAALLVIQIITASLVFFAFPPMPNDMAEIERLVMTQGGFLEVAQYRAIYFAFFVPIALVFQGISALGWFCLGLAAVKSGMIDTPNHPLWARARRRWLGLGLVLSLVGSALWSWGPGPWGEIMVTATAPIATIGYLGLIAAIARPARGLMARLLKAGGASLSVYLGQSICLTFIFCGFGLGLWDAVGPATATLIALAVTLALMIGISLWLSRFAQGPFEVILRRITFAGTAKATTQREMRV